MADRQKHMTSTLEQNYGRALLELADESQTALDDLDGETRALLALIEQQPDMLRLMSVRTLSARERGQIIERMLKGRISDLLFRFIQVVNDKNRLAFLPGMLRAVGTLIEERRGIIEVDAYVAAAMDEPAQRRVAESIGKAMSKEVILHQHVDPSLIGGLKLRVGDKLIDGSVAAQLRQLRQRMIESGRELARTSVR